MIPRAADVPDQQRASVEEALSYMSLPPGEPIAGTPAAQRTAKSSYRKTDEP